MLQPYRNLPRKYCVFLSSTFRDFSIRQEILKHLAHAGLFYFAGEEMSAVPPAEKIKREIEDSDIFILLVKNSLGTSKVRDIPIPILITQFEFEYAREVGKPILAYFTDKGIYGSFDLKTRNFKRMVSETVKYSRVPDDDSKLAVGILTDLLNLIVSEPGLSCWIRSDISQAKVGSIAAQKDQIDKNILRAGLHIQNAEDRLDVGDRDRLVGPLIDIGLRPNLTGQAYRFAVGYTPEGEIGHDALKFEYCMDRFTRYERGVVYDRKLDLTWYIVSNQNFNWDDAIEWEKHLSPINAAVIAKMTPKLGTGGKPRCWRLPVIKELMTLLTDQRRQDAYIDQKVFPGDMYWFWSSTQADNGGLTYYIETTQGQVLKDSAQTHKKAIFICVEGRIENPGKDVPFDDELAPDEDTAALRHANESRRIYGVYLSLMASASVSQEVANNIQPALSRSGYFLTTYTELGARAAVSKDIIQREMENQDYYVLVWDRDGTQGETTLMNRICTEAQIARNLGLPILIFYNLSNDWLATICSRLKLSVKDISSSGHFRDPQNPLHEVLDALEDQRRHAPGLGWIPRRAFEIINRNIDKINSMRATLDTSEKSLVSFIDGCHDEGGLRSVFEGYGFMVQRPKYGEQVWFASRDNPVQRFLARREQLYEGEFPILYEKIPDRFILLSRSGEPPVVRDQYLNLKWWTTAKKGLTYEEALTFARSISQQEGENWRLPTIQEMITLLTQARGSRKYIDEQVFSSGRWFWTATRQGDMVYYIDFNYLQQDTVGREDLSQFTGDNFPPIRKKSAILVADIAPAISPATVVTTQPAAFVQPTQPPVLATSLPSGAPNTQTDNILVITVTEVEAQAVLEVFSQATGEAWSRQTTWDKTYYDLGVHGGAPVFMTQSEMGTATPNGSLLTVRQAIQDLRPQAIIMCGIAFGLHPDKQKLGDILVAKQLEYYEPQKVDLQQGRMPRGDRTTSADRLLERFRSGVLDWKGARTHFGLVLSGETLVNDPDFRGWLLETEPEAVGGEMEGAGLYAAARNAKVDWILVKAICDWADGTKNNDAQLLAARNAAQFVLHVLQVGRWAKPG